MEKHYDRTKGIETAKEYLGLNGPQNAAEAYLAERRKMENPSPKFIDLRLLRKTE